MKLVVMYLEDGEAARLRAEVERIKLQHRSVTLQDPDTKQVEDLCDLLKRAVQ